MLKYQIIRGSNIPQLITRNYSYIFSNLLIKKNPKDFGFLGYSNVKYTCKTKEEHEFDKKYPFD